MMEDFYSLSATDLNGNTVAFEQFRSNVVLVVNTASKGIGRNELLQLNELQKSHQMAEFVILAFPCRQFCQMESKKNQKILNVYQSKLQLCFPVFGLTKVYGDNKSNVFEWLTYKAPGIFGNDVEWNFTKFLVHCDGNTVDRYQSTCSFSMLSKHVNEAIYERSTIMQDVILSVEQPIPQEATSISTCQIQENEDQENERNQKAE